MAEKVTIMVLNVNLQCTKCYKKVKEILCKFPQIRNQEYDEKANTVKITVVCCSPEKIRDKLCCKGRGIIKSIDIIKPPEKKKTNDQKIQTGSDSDVQVAGYPLLYPAYGVCCVPCCYVGLLPGGSCSCSGHGRRPIMPAVAPPCNCGCGGRSMPASPCNCGCGGRSKPASPCNCGCGGRSVCSDGCGSGYTNRRCDLYLIEENPAGCIVM